MRMHILLSIVALLLLSSPAYAADNLYVQSKTAKLRLKPDFSSQVSGELKRGDILTHIKTDKGWHKVLHGKSEGWINSLVVSKNPPMQKVIVITGGEEELEKKSRRRASSITSAAAARGLSGADRKRLSDKTRADFQTLDELEVSSSKITSDDVEKFSTSLK